MDIKESTPSGLIRDDYVINTWSQDNFSVQYERNIEQMPFVYAVPGPLSLRNRSEALIITVRPGKQK